MSNNRDDLPLGELELLKAPARSPAQRSRARAAILAAAEPLLARRRQPLTSLEVLAAWARPGLVAASVALIIFAAALHFDRGRQSAPPVLIDEALASSDIGQVPAFLVAINEPDADAVMAAALTDNANSRRSNEGPEERR